MGKYTGPSCRLCRREGMKLYLKGDKCYTDKCPLARRGYAPGQHGQEKKKLTNYGIQLREKQKLKRYYGVLERQFVRYYEKAERMKGITGENLLQLLERRLDNVVYRLGFASSRPQARQLVSHGHIEVNGKKVDIPSFLVKPGDVIAIREKSRSLELIKNNLEVSRNVPDWLELNKDAFEGRVVSLPRREHIDLPVQEHLIIELYSK
ncbi:MAG TPA: 30S ribosomal protein S4 [Clostridia bacterium]|nr:30S ribosomal protein S4 [Clostridia bacterium]